MKKLTYLLSYLSLFLGVDEHFSFATHSRQAETASSLNSSFFLPSKITKQIIEKICMSYTDQTVDKKTVRKNLTQAALVNKSFYQIVLEVITENKNCWNYFTFTINNSIKNRSFSDVVSSCEKYLLKKNFSFSPLIMTLCLKDMYLGPQEVRKLNTLASYFTQLKNIYLMGVHFPGIKAHEDFQNALEHFQHLASFYAEGIFIPADLLFYHQDYRLFSKTLFSTLKISPFLHQKLQSLFINFNNNGLNNELDIVALKKYARVRSNYGNYSSGDLFDLLLQFLNLKKIALVNANLKEDDALYLRKILSKFSEKIQFLDLSKNPIDNGFINSAFLYTQPHSLQTLNLSHTMVNQNCKIFLQLTNLKYLIMRNCSQLDMSILEKLSKSENLVHSLEELDISNNPTLYFSHENQLKDLLKFKNIQEINIQGSNRWIFRVKKYLSYSDSPFDHLKIIY